MSMPDGNTSIMRVEIREMRLEDVRATVDVHVEAFSGYMNVAMGKAYVRAFLSWFCKAGDGVAFTAWIDGRIVGYVVGAPVGYGSAMTRDLMCVVARSFACRPWLLLRSDIRAVLYSRINGLRKRRRGGNDVEIVQGTTERMISLVGIGVADKARGKGAGGALMEAFESASRKKGMKAMRLSVYRDNLAACHVYERAGWQMMETGDGREVAYRKEIGKAD